MTGERKKRFYPKRGEYVVDDYPVPYEPGSKGRTTIDDSKWIDEALTGIEEGTYKNANQAALKIAVRNGGHSHSIDQNKKRIARKIRNQRRIEPS